jgi:hypothetical protein
MDRSELKRRRDAVLADVARLVGSKDVRVRVIDGPEPLVITRLEGKTARPGALQIIQRHFPGAAVKFEP